MKVTPRLQIGGRGGSWFKIFSPPSCTLVRSLPSRVRASCLAISCTSLADPDFAADFAIREVKHIVRGERQQQANESCVRTSEPHVIEYLELETWSSNSRTREGGNSGDDKVTPVSPPSFLSITFRWDLSSAPPRFVYQARRTCEAGRFGTTAG